MNTPVNYAPAYGMHMEPIESAIISATVGRQRKLPVNLRDIAEKMNATVSFTYCSDAFTHFRPERPTIYVSTAEPRAKKRFIIAHELAHIMLRSPAAMRLIQDRGQAELLENEEDLANRIAGTLLVPDDWLEGACRARPSPTRLLELAYAAGIPLPMLVRRMGSAGTDIALLHWRRGKRSWYVIDRPGMPFFMHGHIWLSPPDRGTLNNLANGESEVVIHCRVNATWVRIKGMVLRFSSRDEQHILQLLAPQSDIRIVGTEKRDLGQTGAATSGESGRDFGST